MTDLSFDRVSRVLNYIQDSWDSTVRIQEKDVPKGRLALPCPYTVPSIADVFQEMYYWDTYFTSLGLILQDRVELARQNADCLLWMMDEYGYVLNGSHHGLLLRSQPPYLSPLVRAVFEKTGDRDWLEHAAAILEREYAFWSRQRTTSSGLNRHGNSADELHHIEFYHDVVVHRLGLEARTRRDKARLGSHYYAEAETGWDFTPRFEQRCEDFNPVDLNSSLFLYETNFAWFANKLGRPDDAKYWEQMALGRQQLMQKLLYDNKAGLYLDYDYVNERHSSIVSAASFHVLYSGAATPGLAQTTVVNGLAKLETTYGILACEPGPRSETYQWDAPNGWPPIQCYAMLGLRRYGYEEEACRIATKYLTLVADVFEKTGKLWEKYNVVEGSLKVNDEYTMPPMIGWTAGIFVVASELVFGKTRGT